MGDITRPNQGGTENLIPYGYTTPADLTTIGANAAAQREAIHVAIIAKINANPNNFVVAATLGGGAGFTVTDDAGYYPAHGQSSTNRNGASQVVANGNSDGSGFVAAQVEVTTAAVYAFGVGATLAAWEPKMNFMSGNLTSGGFLAPVALDGTYAVSGQQYDGYRIETLETADAFNVTGQLALVSYETLVFVDNGAGTATTNLAGYLAFDKAFDRLVANYFSAYQQVVGEFFDSPTFFQGASGAVPVLTDAAENKMATEYGQYVYTLIGAAATVATGCPVPVATGLNLDQDAANGDGSEYTPSLLTACPKEFTVGKVPFSAKVRVIATDHTDATVVIGFRKKAAHQAAFTSYTDLAAVGFLGDLVYTWGALNGAATVSTNTTVVPTDSAIEVYEVRVAIDGTVTALRNGVVYPVYSVGTTALVLDAADVMIPTIRAVNVGGGDPDVIVSEWVAVPSDNWTL